MSAATSRYEAAPATRPVDASPLQRGDGAVEIGFVRYGSRTSLARLYHRTPGRALFPHTEPGEPALALLLTTSGGLTGGDRLTIAIEAAAGTAATATTATAEKIYRSLGHDCAVGVTLDVGEGAWLEYLPQETILFDAARLRRGLTARVAASGRLLAADMTVFGRIARGERFATGFLDERRRVEIGGRLAWIDAARLDGDIADAIDHPAGFGGAAAFATVIYIGADAERHLTLARDLTEAATCRAAVTLVNGILLARFIGEPGAVRAGLWHYVAGLRHAAAGLPARLPRVWRI
jgi:urease accessory protein